MEDVMKSLKTKIALLAVTGAIAPGTMATPAFAAAGPNDSSMNCHGVVLSYQSTSGMAPGQLHQMLGASVKDMQAQADLLCGA
jgi:hypothetical protein